MKLPGNAELNERRTNPPGTRDELRETLERQVVRWEWATGQKYRFEPYAVQLGWKGWGKSLKSPPADPKGHYEFGFDALGDLLIIREHAKSGGRHERLIVRSEGFVREYYYFDGDPREAPRYFIELALEGERIKYLARPGEDELFRLEAYEYQDGKLARVLDKLTGDAHRFEWSGHRLVRVVCRYSHGHESVQWIAKPPSLSRALREMATRLPPAVTRIVAAAGVKEPSFCLLLAYGKSSPLEMSLPKVVIGLQRERETMLVKGGTAEDLFNPAELELFDADALDLEEAPLLAASTEMAAAMTDEADYEKARKLYVKTAKALNKIDWTAMLSPTDDFVVLPVDDEVAELLLNAKGALSAKQRNAHGLK